MVDVPRGGAFPREDREEDSEYSGEEEHDPKRRDAYGA